MSRSLQRGRWAGCSSCRARGSSTAWRWALVIARTHTTLARDPTGFGPDYPVVLVTKGPLAGQYIYYGHVAASLVHVGQRVVAGEPIAVMGHTGNAASLGRGHIEIGFSDGSGDPLNHHRPVAGT